MPSYAISLAAVELAYMHQPIVVDSDVHDYPEVRHIGNNTKKLRNLAVTYLTHVMPDRSGRVLQSSSFRDYGEAVSCRGSLFQPRNRDAASHQLL